MTLVTKPDLTPGATQDITAIARALGPVFAGRAATADETDAFVGENYAELKAAGLVEAGVPADLGGAGAELPELAAMIRDLASHCGSTGLAFAMHTHQVAIPAWRWTRQQAAPVEPLLRRIAKERLVLLSSGGSDWLDGSGTAERVDGGFRITARKVFSSGAPAGDLLMTSAVLEDGEGGPQVLHFGIPMSSPAVRIAPTWKAMGMRGTASNDILIEGHVVPEAAVALRRKQGEWHGLFHIISMIAFPLIYSAYLGVAEGARDIAIRLGQRREPGRHAIELYGRMETELRAARYAHAAMLAAAGKDKPGPETTNEVMAGRVLTGRHAIAAVEWAMEAVGGSAFYRDNGLERRFREVQGARYHPLRPGVQEEFAGRIALGLDTAHTY